MYPVKSGGLLLVSLLALLVHVEPFSFQTQRTVPPLPSSSTSSSKGSSRSDNFYTWKNNYNIHYNDVGVSGPPLLLIPGFGVGTFHYGHQLDALSSTHRVFSFDLLGQGRSWPDNGMVNAADRLSYSADMWVDQTIHFIENICQEPVHLAGNSLGGYLALAVAARRPDLVKSLILLNAAPFWAFQPPRTDDTASSSGPGAFLWDGVLPAPSWMLAFGSAYFDLMRSPTNVRAMLKTVYATEAGFDDALVDDILAAANRPGGQEAFTSILFSPKMRETFDEMLDQVQAPVCLIYGREDPWIVPYWGQRAKKRKPDVAYFELSPSGHCPHHETPTATNAVLSAWVDEVEAAGPNLLPVGRADKSDDAARMADVAARVGRRAVGSYVEGKTNATVSVSAVEGTPRTVMERLAALFNPSS